LEKIMAKWLISSWEVAQQTHNQKGKVVEGAVIKAGVV
jgi:hypothetical protein